MHIKLADPFPLCLSGGPDFDLDDDLADELFTGYEQGVTGPHYTNAVDLDCDRDVN